MSVPAGSVFNPVIGGISAGFTIGKLALQISPIILTGGIAILQGGYLPIVELTNGIASIAALTGGALALTDPSLDGFFASFEVLPGATLISNQFGQYPFANQGIAANAVIAQPLRVSMLMTVPASPSSGGFAGKLATMILLQRALQQHTLSGGTFSVITQSYLYTSMLLENLSDASGGGDTQKQVQWRWDFFAPLVTLQAAAGAQNSLTQALSSGTPTPNAVSFPAALPTAISTPTPSTAPPGGA